MLRWSELEAVLDHVGIWKSMVAVFPWHFLATLKSNVYIFAVQSLHVVVGFNGLNSLDTLKSHPKKCFSRIRNKPNLKVFPPTEGNETPHFPSLNSSTQLCLVSPNQTTVKKWPWGSRSGEFGGHWTGWERRINMFLKLVSTEEEHVVPPGGDSGHNSTRLKLLPPRWPDQDDSWFETFSGEAAVDPQWSKRRSKHLANQNHPF